jgi:hypothetical protein
MITAGQGTNQITYKAGAPFTTATFKVVVTDSNGCTTMCTATVTTVQTNVVTDTERCIFDLDPSTTKQEFRLIYTQDVQSPGGYKLNASNPGQYFYNVFYMGNPGDPVNLAVTLPYPFETQGANPVHAYDMVHFSSIGGKTCLTTGNEVPVTSNPQTVDVNTCSVPVPANSSAGAGMNIGATVPSSGFLFIAIHIDYGLKGCTGYGKDSNNNAVAAGTTNVLIPSLGNYHFSVGGSVIGSTDICNINDFKKNPGVGGMSLKNLTDTAVPGATVTLYDPAGQPVGAGVTDQDGYYMITYKHTGKAATFTTKIVTPGGFTQTKSVAMKANAFAQVDFTVP